MTQLSKLFWVCVLSAMFLIGFAGSCTIWSWSFLIIFGTLVWNDDTSRPFFYCCEIFIFQAVRGVKGKSTVKLVLTTTFLKQPPALNDHVLTIWPYVFRSNFSLYSDHLYSATSDHLNDVPGFLLPAYNDHCTKCLS